MMNQFMENAMSKRIGLQAANDVAHEEVERRVA